ncbi:Ppx/GppA phosphatase family protein [Aporhodopirellula aestuarii]|uniref:Ppx/GppA family phosphatase n=1 Tax=Aporhodopirellula aestuarii TaxID=2950107 RepID=A0ABT0U010_9BACT|nr:Ppx/GppA phosphatase family protein [Aporhodopirellula aestuarii]MCM2370160.1 Ppx/GppA family phosphatase [Aporhodopirellula aestuarii]
MTTIDSSSPPLELGQGRLQTLVPIAVIDIGSNSVRQVIYEGLTPAPSVLFNEKVLCGLGRGMVKSNRLNESGVERTFLALKRFRALANQLNVAKTHVIATAAVRDAENGEEFIEAVTRITGCQVEVLTGPMEARYSAMGIQCGFHRPTGIAGDIGGGSLELITVEKELGEGITLPLGGLKLAELSGGSLSVAKKLARAKLKEVSLNWPGIERNFYAIGGTWRSLAKLHIANKNYPLPLVHDYELSATEMMDFCKSIATDDLSKVTGIEAVSRNRRDLLPIGAVVMRETLRALKADRVVMSSVGLREGVLYSMLSPEEQSGDSLLEACQDLSTLRSRNPEHCLELATWTDAAFATLGIEESEDDRRHRTASCYLADIAWRAHPDFRAQQYIGIIGNAGFVGITHEGRAYLAMANYYRYTGLGSKVNPPAIAALASPAVQKKARVLAAMFRVLYLFSATMPGVISKLTLRKDDAGAVILSIPESISGLCGERPNERIRQLGNELGMDVTLEVV